MCLFCFVVVLNVLCLIGICYVCWRFVYFLVWILNFLGVDELKCLIVILKIIKYCSVKSVYLLVNFLLFYSEGYMEKCVMNNYFGIGLDVKIVLDFYIRREEYFEKFRLVIVWSFNFVGFLIYDKFFYILNFCYMWVWWLIMIVFNLESWWFIFYSVYLLFFCFIYFFVVGIEC